MISATNADIQAEVQAGRFRQDLLFRLNTIEIRIPPLRERREDIPVLAGYFLQQHNKRYRKQMNNFDPAAMQALLKYSWPGNIRELDHTIERAVLLAHSDRLRVEDLGLQAQKETPKGVEEMSLEEVEAFLIKKALDRYNGNVSQAAKALGLSRSALYRRLQRHGL
jgi:DNA-binding NtrC family response regulator